MGTASGQNNSCISPAYFVFSLCINLSNTCKNNTTSWSLWGTSVTQSNGKRMLTFTEREFVRKFSRMCRDWCTSADFGETQGPLELITRQLHSKHHSLILHPLIFHTCHWMSFLKFNTMMWCLSTLPVRTNRVKKRGRQRWWWSKRCSLWPFFPSLGLKSSIILSHVLISRVKSSFLLKKD